MRYVLLKNNSLITNLLYLFITKVHSGHDKNLITFFLIRAFRYHNYVNTDVTSVLFTLFY